MNTPDPSPPDIHLLPITEVEQLTGIRQGTLRMWERRYGFPCPLRDEHGNRVYPVDQVERLLEARHLILQGHRPGRIFAAAGSLPALSQPAPVQPFDQHEMLIGLLRAYRLAELHAQFQYRLMRLGLRDFVLGCLAPLSAFVTQAVARRELPLRCLRVYTHLVSLVLHAALAAVRTVEDGRPKAVLATLSGDHRGLGIVMAEALLTTLEVDCIQLGTDTPLAEVAATAAESDADIVAISFDPATSAASAPRRELGRVANALRIALPASATLWAGGANARQAAPGIVPVPSLADIEPALARWRAGRESRASQV